MGLRLADLPTSDLALVTSVGAVSVSALDGQTILVWAGGYKYAPGTRFGPLRVNRVAVDVVARFTADEHDEWHPEKSYGLVVRRAGSFENATRNAFCKVREALLPAVRSWAAANPDVLAAAQYRACCDQITGEQATLRQLYDQVVQHEQQIAELARQRDELASRWTTPAT